jgi:hypothetical protein
VSRTAASRLAAMYVLVLICGAAAVEGWRSAHFLADRAASERSGDPSRRVVGGAWILDVDRIFVTAAKAYVSADGGTYSLEVGPSARISPLARRFLPTYLRGELLPASPAPRSSADWLLCYGCPYNERPRFKPVWTDGAYAIGRRVQ